jgi:hypothetical protein
MKIMFSPKLLVDARRRMSTYKTRFLDSTDFAGSFWCWSKAGAFPDGEFKVATMNCSLSATYGLLNIGENKQGFRLTISFMTE